MNNFLNRLGLAQRTALLCGVLCLCVALAVVMVSMHSSRYILAQQRAHIAQQLGNSVAADASDSLASGDLLSLEATLRRALTAYELQYLAIFDLEQREISAAGVSLGPDNRQFRSTIRISGDIAGELLLELQADGAQQEQKYMHLGIFFLALLLSLFAAALAATQGQKVARRIMGITEKLDLSGHGEQTPDEILDLERQVAKLPLELLKAPDTAPGSISDYEEACLLYVRLNSLGNYVETLDESSILRFTEMQRKLVADTAALHGGTLSVARQFGLLVSFSGDHASGSPAFRAAATAWLIQQQQELLQPRIRLRLSLSMAIAMNEAGVGSRGDIYPDLYAQHIIDDLAASVATEPTDILLSEGAAADGDVASRCIVEHPMGEGHALAGFEEPWQDLVVRQRDVLG